MASNGTYKGTNAFTDTIRQYLENKAKNDSLFAIKFANPSKSVEDCVTYIINEVKKSGCNGFADAEIYGMAVHFYEEAEIEVGNPINCQVVVNHTVELTEEEKEQARQDAIERLRQEEMAKMRKPIQAKKATTEKKTQDVQPSLFDF
ncbi:MULTISPECIES: PcfK-like family protein [Bacteroidales]|mgnify:FL=1|jgi:predicted CopG family antitoxin|uniref:PcfK-like family protein n=3 Tax=Bacteroidia TaxID=200643 RepID=UPI000A49ED2D|nr:MULTISPECIES: PcfK-like family protein [Bacteroidales]MCX4278686.1 PcfK-like family protein [Muribaculum sp.]